MTVPQFYPHAVFTGALGDPATGGWYPAQVVVSDGTVTLWIASQTGWQQHFTAPAGEVIVKSAAQRITLKVRGQSYPILADQRAVQRALNLTAMGIAGNVLGLPRATAVSGVGRGVNQLAAARAFSAGGGREFLAAMRRSGAPVSRLGFGAIAAIGCVAGLAVVMVVVGITVTVL